MAEPRAPRSATVDRAARRWRDVVSIRRRGRFRCSPSAHREAVASRMAADCCQRVSGPPRSRIGSGALGQCSSVARHRRPARSGVGGVDPLRWSWTTPVRMMQGAPSTVCHLHKWSVRGALTPPQRGRRRWVGRPRRRPVVRRTPPVENRPADPERAVGARAHDGTGAARAEVRPPGQAPAVTPASRWSVATPLS